jgi:hypothetical protein
MEHSTYSAELEPLENAAAWFQRLCTDYDADRAVKSKWQRKLGNALFRLSERESDTAHLKEAVAAYCDSSDEHSRAHEPLQWAMTQNNLGEALFRLAGREAWIGGFEQAVVAYRARWRSGRACACRLNGQ